MKTNILCPLFHPFAQVLSSFTACGDSDLATLGLHKLKLDPGEADEFYHLEHIPIEKQEHDPLYEEERSFAHDFVVLKLKWATQLYADQVVVLDSPNDGFELSIGDQLVTMGFGDYAGADHNVLQEIGVQYVSNDQCTSPDGEAYSPDEIICTTRAPGGDYPVCLVSLCLPPLCLVILLFNVNCVPCQFLNCSF